MRITDLEIVENRSIRRSSSERKRLQVSGLDQTVNVTFDGRCNGVVGPHDPDLDVPQLGCLSQIGRSNKDLGMAPSTMTHLP